MKSDVLNKLESFTVVAKGELVTFLGPDSLLQ